MAAVQLYHALDRGFICILPAHSISVEMVPIKELFYAFVSENFLEETVVSWMWDVRKAKGCSMMLDQHNGDTSALPNSGSFDNFIPSLFDNFTRFVTIHITFEILL